MLLFFARRLLHTIPILLGVSLLTFLLMSLTPGDYYTQLAQNPQITPRSSPNCGPSSIWTSRGTCDTATG